MSASSAMPPSLWTDTAPSAPQRFSLTGHQRTDVLIVGGGFTGVSAALALGERGVSTTLVETNAIGWGASGRNGGQVIPGLKYDPDELIQLYGPEQGQKMIDISGRNADVVFDLIRQHQIDCDAVQKGWLQPAATHTSVGRIESRARQWADRGIDIEWLDQPQCAQRLGTHEYLAAWRDPRAGSVNPLAYVRGLAQAAENAGAKIFESSPVTALTRHADGWQAQISNQGTVVADQVLLCTNGYTDQLQKGLARSLIAANSFQIATRPLTEAEGGAILPQGEVASDARKLLFYFRRDRTGRFLMGGRGPFHEPRRPADFSHLHSWMTKLYPSLKDVAIEYYWGGRVALTQDSIPHVHQPTQGMTVALGYNGRGVGMGTHLGKLIGENLGTDALETALPFPLSPIRPIPLHGLQRLYVSTVINYYRARDWLER